MQIFFGGHTAVHAFDLQPWQGGSATAKQSWLLDCSAEESQVNQRVFMIYEPFRDIVAI